MFLGISTKRILVVFQKELLVKGMKLADIQYRLLSVSANFDLIELEKATSI